MILLEDIIKRFLFENDEITRPAKYNDLSKELQKKFKDWLSSQNLTITGSSGTKQKLTAVKSSSAIYDDNLEDAADTWWNTLADKDKLTVSTKVSKNQAELDAEMGITPEMRTKYEQEANFLPGSWNPKTGYGKCKPDFVKQDESVASPCIAKTSPWIQHVLDYGGYYVIAFLLLGTGPGRSILKYTGVTSVLKGISKMGKDGIFYLIGKWAGNRMTRKDSGLTALFLEADDAIKALIQNIQNSKKLTKTQKQTLPRLAKEMQSLMKIPSVRKELATEYIKFWKNQYRNGQISMKVLYKILGERYIKSADFNDLINYTNTIAKRNPNWNKDAIQSVKELDKIGMGKYSDITDPKLRSYIDGIWM